jgi:hypothetical protein
MIASRFLDHIRYQFRSDRRSTLVLLVLPSVWEQGDDCRNAFCARNFAGMDHDAKFHERRIHGTAPSIDDIDVEFSHRLCDSNIGFPDTTSCYFCFGKWNANAAEYAA